METLRFQLLGKEKKTNFVLQQRTETEFLDFMSSD